MESNGERKQVCDAEHGAALVTALRWSYGTGRTRSYEWRADQLRGFLRMMEEKEGDVHDALRADLGKPELEAFVQEVCNCNPDKYNDPQLDHACLSPLPLLFLLFPLMILACFALFF